MAGAGTSANGGLAGTYWGGGHCTQHIYISSILDEDILPKAH